MDINDTLMMLHFVGACCCASIIVGLRMLWQRWPR